MTENLHPIVVVSLQILLPAIGTLLVALLGFGSAWLNAKADQIKNETVQEKTTEYIFNLQQVMASIVDAATKTVVDGLKEANADGKLTPEEQVQIKATVSNTIKAQLTEEGRAMLGTIVADIDIWIDAWIESYLKRKEESSRVL